MIDLQHKKIIMIHGVARKPPKHVWTKLSARALIENIRMYDAELAEGLELHREDVFHPAYWANVMPYHVPYGVAHYAKLAKHVGLVIAARQEAADEFHVPGFSEWSSFFKTKGVELASLITDVLTIKDDVIKGVLEELKAYDADSFLSTCIREVFLKALLDIWDEDPANEVAIISHSMGTMVAYDCLWVLSHRDTPDLKKYRDRKVKLFVTMGSPLGDNYARDAMISQMYTERFPTNIEHWHNYACLGDIVCYTHDFWNKFWKPMVEAGLFTGETWHTKNYVNLHNPFVSVNSNKPNPHKSYGYLVQPRLGSWMADFLRGNLE